MLSKAVINEFQGRMKSAEAELSLLPTVLAAMRKQNSDLPAFFLGMGERNTQQIAGPVLSMLIANSVNPGSRTRAIIQTNKVWYNIYGTYFDHGMEDAAPAVIARAQVSSGVAADVRFVSSDGFAGASSGGTISRSRDSRSQNTRGIRGSQSGAVSSSQIDQFLSSRSQMSGGGSHSDLRSFKPVSANIVGRRLGVSRDMDAPRECSRCLQPPNAWGQHRTFECPAVYFENFSEVCPGFDASYARLASAWTDGELTDSTRQKWIHYIAKHNIPASIIEGKEGPVRFESGASAEPPARQAGRGRRR
jgi:hypothetical protein